MADPTSADQQRAESARRDFREGIDRLRSVAESRRLFGQAAQGFQELHKQGVRSPALYRALGNAEALAGRLPQAIWAYHCGLQLDANDRALRTHLDYARSLINYPAGSRGRPGADIWPLWLHRPTSGQWLALALAAYGLTWIAGGWWYVQRRTLSLVVTLGFFTVAVAAGSGHLLAAGQAEYDRDHPLVIVAAERTTLHKGNGTSYPLHDDMPRLPPGLEARRLHQRGGWLHVQVSTGELGWLPADRVLVVQPR
jgi:hypothetical protein